MFFLRHVWVRTGVLTLLLLPLSTLFAAVSGLRRLAYRYGWLRTVSVGVPVIVVGNITAGGSGKTPLVIWLANWLRSQGHRPGVISRGYGGTARGCVEVQTDSAPAWVGDEPALIRLKTEAPVVIGRDRAGAACMLRAQHPEVDVIVSDDGLQHYRLHRDIELAVIDAATGLGNGWLLPAGPLREPRSRLLDVDAVVQVVRGAVQPHALDSVVSWRADFSTVQAYRLNAPQERKMMRDLPRHDWLAVTGIGQPQGFFAMLDAHGLRYRPRAFPDHHVFRPADIPAGEAVLMTEKDAVKCRGFAGPDWWVVELDVTPDQGFVRWLDARLKQ
ncbi:MAG: tetraacyldisaccharide 4'-kinase [Thiobacillus sp. 63-78]|uniref:tetraacyldisaccharide 4'-kinase n=1 Tax=Thiobacillus sp. 63-78 TaxID=1895859 RepID=UPI0009636D11|nr:tetraacyldisaccharide 4'-kinase [Thiobacillus sp. 63-78]MBN8773668.1 tetraacyldisaccharide 4'-kinase [Thiobacillus sp.]OJZ16588.1 MAG: tetraacyldisaccharide 4'-kinase [Thiobacillus sp. 63-78]